MFILYNNILAEDTEVDLFIMIGTFDECLNYAILNGLTSFGIDPE